MADVPDIATALALLRIHDDLASAADFIRYEEAAAHHRAEADATRLVLDRYGLGPDHPLRRSPDPGLLSAAPQPPDLDRYPTGDPRRRWLQVLDAANRARYRVSLMEVAVALGVAGAEEDLAIAQAAARAAAASAELTRTEVLGPIQRLNREQCQ